MKAVTTTTTTNAINIWFQMFLFSDAPYYVRGVSTYQDVRLSSSFIQIRTYAMHSLRQKYGQTYIKQHSVGIMIIYIFTEWGRGS